MSLPLFIDLVRRHPRPAVFHDSTVAAALAQLSGEHEAPDPIAIAVASLGDPADAVQSLVDENAVPDLMTAAEEQGLCTRLGVSSLDRETLRGNLRDVAEYLGLETPATATAAALPPRGSAGYPLFAHQRRAVQEITGHLDGGARRILLHMPTGAGKTRTAMNLVCEHLRRGTKAVAWLASTGELCEQAATEFVKAWHYLGNRDVQMNYAWGGRSWTPDDVHDGLLVATPQTLHHRSKSFGFTTWLADNLSLIVFDEAHQAIASTYAQLSTAISGSHTPILGLTATPGRTYTLTEQDDALAVFFDHNKVALDTSIDGGPSNPIRWLIANGYLADTRFELLGDLPSQADGGEVSFDLTDDPQSRMSPVEYLELALSGLEDLIDEGHTRIIVFAASVRLAEQLSAMLVALGIRATCVHGATDSSLRAARIRQYRDSKSPQPRVLVNYGVLTTGFDAPRTSAAVIARPTNSLVLYSQMVGRATRGPKAGGNMSATVLTVVDPTVPAFGTIADAFSNWEDLW